MRILHTADWHLGRILCGVHLVEDQAWVLDRLVELARTSRPDVLIVAGDVYDRAVPPPDAVALLDDVLARLVKGLGLPVVVIAGNHDAPQRVGFGARLFEDRGLHVRGVLEATIAPVVIADRWGPVTIYPVPYVEPAVARQVLAAPQVQDHHTAMQLVIDTLRAPARVAEGAGIAVRAASSAAATGMARSVLVAHAFVAGGLTSESERPLSVGGAGAVEAQVLDGFDYVALGHLHRPQQVGSDRVAYSGSLLKYSFDEVDHLKSVRLVELDDTGALTSEPVPLGARHDVRRIEGTLDALLAAAGPGGAREDYLQVRLTDPLPVLDAMGRLRAVYPNVLDIVRPVIFDPGAPAARVADPRRLDDAALFAAFFERVTGGAPSDQEAEAFAQVADRVRRADREAGA